MISPDSTNIQPDWLRSLLKPISTEGFDLVLPTYTRHKFDGLLVTNLLYPVSRALYGLRIREPYASEFAFSNRLGSHFLSENSWNDEAAREGCEVRFTLAAIAGGFRIGQAYLGAKDPLDRSAADLVPALRQTIGVLFGSMESNLSVWSSKTGSQRITTIGADQQFALEPRRINRKRLHEMFRVRRGGIGISVLSIHPCRLPRSEELRKIAGLEEEDLSITPRNSGVKPVYEFAVAHHKAVINRDYDYPGALAPLFRVGERWDIPAGKPKLASAAAVEEHIENLCLEFERLQPYLLELWKDRE